MASLFVIRGRDQGKRFEIDQSTAGLGRDISNAIQLANKMAEGDINGLIVQNLRAKESLAAERAGED